MPRGFPPTLNVVVSLSVAVSMTDTDAEPSLETYAKGAANAPRAVVADRTVAPIMSRVKRMTFAPSNQGGTPQWRGCRLWVILHEFAATHRRPERGRT